MRRLLPLEVADVCLSIDQAVVGYRQIIGRDLD
jgi:hypothetical protein